MTRQDSGDFARLSAAADSAMLPVSLDYAGVRELSDLLGEAEGNVLGIILGSSSPSGILVKRLEPLRVGSGSESGDPQRVRESMLQLIERCTREATPERGQPVGIFRTQQGGWASITDFDAKLIRRCLPFLTSAGRIFLVIRNFAHRPRSGAVFSLDGAPPSTATPPALEFPFDEYLLRKGYLTDDPDPMAFPTPQPQPHAGRRNWLLVAGLAGVAFLIGAGVWRWSRGGTQPGSEVQENVAPSQSIALKVGRSGSDMEISWNRLSDAVLNASGATLTIRDGPMVRMVALNTEQLREGHIWFAPLPGKDLDLRFEVSKGDGTTIAESVKILGWDTASPLTASAGKAPNVAGERSNQAQAEIVRKVPVVPPPAQPVNPPAVQPPVQTGVRPANQTQPPAQTEAARQVVPQPTGEPANQTPPRTVPQVQTAPDAAKPAPASPPSPVPGTPSGSATGAPESNPPATQAASPVPAASNPVEQIPAPRNVPSSPAPPVVERPKPAAPPAATPNYTGPSPIRKVNPSLTQEARAELRRTSKKVTVSVRLDIDESGSVRNAEAVGVTGEPANGGVYVKLVAMAAARQWKFRPATINGKNVPSQMTVVFEY